MDTLRVYRNVHTRTWRSSYVPLPEEHWELYAEGSKLACFDQMVEIFQEQTQGDNLEEVRQLVFIHEYGQMPWRVMKEMRHLEGALREGILYEGSPMGNCRVFFLSLVGRALVAAHGLPRQTFRQHGETDEQYRQRSIERWGYA